MKGQKIRWQIVPILLVSAVLGFGQTAGMNQPNGQWQRPSADGQAPMQPVGPGTINYVEGQVSLNGQELTASAVGNASLKPGEVLQTGNGYVEVLLTPGAFLRLGHNTDVQIPSAGLADTNIQLLHGTGILEVDQLIKGTNLAVTMKGATTQIEKNGLYQFDAAQQSIMVHDGKVRVQTAAGSQSLGKHDQLLLASERPMKKRSFDENSVKAEPLYVWSMARSEDESQASMRAASRPNYYLAAGPGWFWDSAWGGYGFWPATSFLYSPFGWGFYSPAYFGFGYYGGYYRGGYSGFGYYGRPVSGVRVNGINARVSAFHSSGFSGGFHGGGGHR